MSVLQLESLAQNDQVVILEELTDALSGAPLTGFSGTAQFKDEQGNDLGGSLSIVPHPETAEANKGTYIIRVDASFDPSPNEWGRLWALFGTGNHEAFWDWPVEFTQRRLSNA